VCANAALLDRGKQGEAALVGLGRRGAQLAADPARQHLGDDLLQQAADPARAGVKGANGRVAVTRRFGSTGG
jgi:hypothetical protein